MAAQNIIELGYDVDDIDRQTRQVLEKLIAVYDQAAKINDLRIDLKAGTGAVQMKQIASDLENMIGSLTTKVNEYNVASAKKTEIDQKQAKATADVKKQNEDLQHSISESKSVVDATSKSILESAKSYNELSAKLKSVKAAMKDAGGDDLAKLTARETELKQAMRSTMQGMAAQTKEINAQSGSYRQLEAQVQKMELAWKSMGAEMRNSAAGTDLQKSISSTKDQLKALDATIGDHRKNVGNYASAWNPLENSLTQLTREMPAFANSAQTGFMAISNNFSAIQDAIKGLIAKNKELKASGEQTIPIWKSLAGAINPFTLALNIGITLLTMYGADIVKWATILIKGKNAADDLAESTKYLNEQTKSMASAIKQANVSAQEEAQHLILLNKVATDNAQTYAVRVKAAKELQQEQSGTLKNYSVEAIMTGKVADVITDKLIPAYKAAAIAQSASSEIGRLEVEKAYQETNRKAQDAARHKLQPQIDALNKYIETAAKMPGREGYDPLSNVPKNLKEAAKYMDQTNKQTAITDNNLKGINSRIAILNNLIKSTVTKGGAVIAGIGGKETDTNGKSKYDGTKAIEDNAAAELKARNEAAKEALQVEVDKWKAIAESDQYYITERVKAYNKEKNALIKINELDKNTQLAAVQSKQNQIVKIEQIAANKRTAAQKSLLAHQSSIEAQRISIIEKYGSKEQEIKNRIENQILKATKKYLDETKKAAEDLYKDSQSYLESNGQSLGQQKALRDLNDYTSGLIKLSEAYKNGKFTLAEYNTEKNKLDKSYKLADLAGQEADVNQQIKSTEKKISSYNIAPDDASNKEVNDLRKQLYELTQKKRTIEIEIKRTGVANLFDADSENEMQKSAAEQVYKYEKAVNELLEKYRKGQKGETGGISLSELIKGKSKLDKDFSTNDQKEQLGSTQKEIENVNNQLLQLDPTGLIKGNKQIDELKKKLADLKSKEVDLNIKIDTKKANKDIDQLTDTLENIAKITESAGEILTNVMSPI